MTVTQGIAEYIARTEYENIPPSVIKMAKECTLDSIGDAFYGFKFEASQIALALFGTMSAVEKGASVLCTGTKVLPHLASFINGIMAHVADFDDVLYMLRGYTSCVIMPAAIAACEVAGRSGKDFLTAFVVGTEVMGSRHYEVGWHSTGTIGFLGAAAAASKALKLEPSKVANALGIAASSATGLRVSFGTMTKSFHVGHAAMTGVLAAQLAEKGFDASPTVLEETLGFANLFGGAGEISSVVKDLGTNYALNEIMLKLYPSCAGTHSAVDGILRIREKINGKLQDIEAIEIHVRPTSTNVLFYHNPETVLQGKFSMEFCVAAALIFGKLGISQFQTDSLFNPHVKDIMKKVILIPDGEMERTSREKRVLSPAQITVKTVEGKEYCETIFEAKGSPSNPMSNGEIQEKFRECARHALPDSNVEAALEAIESLETLRNISELISKLVY